MPYRPSMIDALEPRRFCDSLTAGVTANTVVSTAKPNRNWSISLTAGQAVYLAAGETGGASAFQTQLILIAPTGKAIARSVGDSGAFVSRVAPVTGTYVVRVRDTNGTNRSGVKVTAFYAGGQTVADNDGEGDPVGLADSGRRYPATISPGDLDVWRIDGTNPGFLSVVLNENDRGSVVGVGVALIGPDGRGVKASESDSGFVLDTKTVASGTYYAVVFEPGANATGRYGISFGRTPGGQTTEDPDTQQPLVSGTPRTGDLPAGDTDLFKVTFAKGTRVSINATKTGGTTTPAFALVDPNGTVVAQANGGSATASISYTTLTAGSYAIVLRNRDASTGGQYRLTYTTD